MAPPKMLKKNKYKVATRKAPAVRYLSTKPLVANSGAQSKAMSMVGKASGSLKGAMADYLRTVVEPSGPWTAKIPDDSNSPSTAVKIVTRRPVELVDGIMCLTVSPATPQRLYTVTTGALAEFDNPIDPSAYYADLVSMFDTCRVVSASVEILQSFANNQNPGVGYCAQIPARTGLVARVNLPNSRTTHREPLAHGCYMRAVTTANPETGRQIYLPINSTDQFLDRMQILITNATPGLKYEFIITVNYELIASNQKFGTIFAAPPPIAREALDSVQRIAAKVPTNASRDFVRENGATSSLGREILDQAGAIAGGIVDSIMPKPLAGLVKGLGSALAGLF